MTKVGIYKLDQKMGDVFCDSQGVVTAIGDADFKLFINDLHDADYPSNEAFVRDLPQRLSGFVWAQVENNS